MIITTAQGVFDTGFNSTQQPLIQNLGPGILYLYNLPTSVTTEGIQIPSGAVYELPAVVQDGAGKIYIQATTASCDVRMLNVG